MQVALNLIFAQSVLNAVQQVQSNANFLLDIPKTITAPDIHGHPLKLFFFVLCTGVIKLDTEEEKENFKESYTQLVQAYDKKNAQDFFDTLNNFTLNTEIIGKYKNLRLTILIVIGDTLCDRAKGGDNLTLKLYQWLKKNNIQWEELFSNHSAGTLALYHLLEGQSEENKKKIIEKLYLLFNPTFKAVEKNKNNNQENLNKIIAEENKKYSESITNEKLGLLKSMKTLAGHPITGTAPFQSESLFSFLEEAKNNEKK